MGKTICDKLDASRNPGIIQQASRALMNLWAEAPVPHIVSLLPDNSPACPELRSGCWLIQEYTLRGESFSLIHVHLSFDPATGSMVGGGYDLMGEIFEEFEITGRLLTSQGSTCFMI